MSDLIERLREWAKWCHDNNVKAEVQRTMHEAADEIERLRAALEKIEDGWMEEDVGAIAREALEDDDFFIFNSLD